MVELTSPCWWRRLARALRARQSSGREVLAAVILAAALLLGYRLTGSKIELSSRLHLWYEEKELWVRLHLRAAPSPPSQSAPAAGYGSGLNPFLATVGTSSGFRPMPFLDFVYEGNSPDINPARDYFGFRNKRNLYFERRPRRLIVVSGNSEAIGDHHHIPIADRLEGLLNRAGCSDCAVLNLAMNNYSLPYEMQAYLSLIYQERPDLVFSISLWSDALDGRSVPREFGSLGLFYEKSIHEDWLKAIYPNGYVPSAFERQSVLTPAQIANSIIKNALKYKSLVEGNGGKFVWVIQLFDRDASQYDKKYQPFVIRNLDFVSEIYDVIKKTLRANPGRLTVIDLNEQLVFDELKSNPVDPVHTDDEGAERVSELLADFAERALQAAPK